MAKSATRMRFDRAFKDARDSGDKTFEFEGKSYNTRIAGEGKSSGKSVPLPPKRDVPTVEDPEKKYPEEPVEASPRGYYNQKLNEDGESKPFFKLNSEMPQKRYGTVRTGEGDTGETGDSKPFFKLNSEMPQKRYGTVRTGEESTSSEEGYRKGGMVKKKSGGMMKKSGGSVRGAGVAQRGQGKMRMC